MEEKIKTEKSIATDDLFCEQLLSVLEMIATVPKELEDRLKVEVINRVFTPYVKAHGAEQAKEAISRMSDYMLGFMIAVSVRGAYERIQKETKSQSEPQPEDWAKAVEKATGEEIE